MTFCSFLNIAGCWINLKRVKNKYNIKNLREIKTIIR